jgi:hypothetical protein
MCGSGGEYASSFACPHSPLSLMLGCCHFSRGVDTILTAAIERPLPKLSAWCTYQVFSQWQRTGPDAQPVGGRRGWWCRKAGRRTTAAAICKSRSDMVSKRLATISVFRSSCRPSEETLLRRQVIAHASGTAPSQSAHSTPVLTSSDGRGVPTMNVEDLSK